MKEEKTTTESEKLQDKLKSMDTNTRKFNEKKLKKKKRTRKWTRR